jgi:hypothetical protein
MFEKFEGYFTRDPFTPKPAVAGPLTTQSVPELRDYFARFAGLSFDKGLYRVMDFSTLWEAADCVSLAFPKFAKRAKCFAYDWLGRIFALDLGRLREGKPNVVMFELDEGVALDIPFDLASFHDFELVDEPEVVLSSQMHSQWLARGGGIPKPNRCIGRKIPLFLSGPDTIENLGITDLSVHWHITAQLIDKTRDLPPGTKIRNIVFEK